MGCSSGECCGLNTTIPITSHCVVCETDQTSCRTCESGYNKTNGICVKNEEGGGNSAGVIVGVVIGCVVLIGIITFIIIYFIILPKHINNNDKYVSMDDVGCDGLEVYGEIGHGATSVVYKGRYGGKDVAVKVINHNNDDDGEGLRREIELMKKLKNPYIIEVYDECVLSGHVGIVMEYVPLGTYVDVMMKGVFSGSLKMRYVREICVGMRYLHSMKIIHRDLKLDNILVMSTSESWSIESGICKISDFGTARETDISRTLSMSQSMTMTSNIGTPLYMAPEILSGQSHYSVKADVYSYGIVLCGVWNQHIPYSDMTFSSPAELYKGIVESGVRPSLGSDCPQPYIQLVSACLQSDPHSRPSFDEICSSVFGVN